MAYNQFPEHPDDSIGGWMLTLFLMGLPLVGFVYLLVLVAVLFFVLFGAAIMASLPDSSM